MLMKFFCLIKTYCINKQVADSACSATAYLSGVKSTYETIGVTGKVSLNDCKGQNYAETRTVSIGEWAQNKCKATGIVTTTKITDASPSGVYARECFFLYYFNYLFESINLKEFI